MASASTYGLPARPAAHQLQRQNRPLESSLRTCMVASSSSSRCLRCTSKTPIAPAVQSVPPHPDNDRRSPKLIRCLRLRFFHYATYNLPTENWRSGQGFNRFAYGAQACVCEFCNVGSSPFRCYITQQISALVGLSDKEQQKDNASIPARQTWSLYSAGCCSLSARSWQR